MSGHRAARHHHGRCQMAPEELDLIGDGPLEALADTGGTGGEGQEHARLPAVLAVKLPHWSRGEDSCYVTSTLPTNHSQRGLSVQLVNY